MRNFTRLTRRAWRQVVVVALLASVFAGASTAGAAGATDGTGSVGPDDDGRRSYTGNIDGADYRVEMPGDWNGTLVLYSHGYYPPQFPFEGLPVTNNADTEGWLLDNGFAVAASNYRGIYGFLVPQAQRDQIALLDWFETNVGEPDRTISMGQSQGATIATLLTERHPDRFDGVVTLCGQYDPHAGLNVGLDVGFAVRTLLTPEEQAATVELVHPGDAANAEADTLVLQQAIEDAMTTPEGRARLALVASLGNVTGWWSAHEPQPTDPVERIRQQANWLSGAYIGGYAGPIARLDLEPKAGGNPSSNVGIDYRHQFARSSQTALVEEAYRAAGLDHRALRADLDQLNAAPRIAPDPAAVDFMYRTISQGLTTVPGVSLHTTGDGGAVPDQERWFAEQVRRHGDPNQLRQLYVERGQHCSFSAAEEAVALQAVLRKLDTGRWPNLSPRRLDDRAGQFPPHQQRVYDLGAGIFPFPAEEMPPAFVTYQPPRYQRPSR